MSAETPENDSDAASTNDRDPYDAQVLRGLAPDSLGDEGTRALVTAIRNPDATPGQLAAKCDLGSTYTVTHALRSVLRADSGAPVEYGQHIERRGGEARDAQTHAELTDKQQAIIDFAAEHPTFVEERTYADVVQALHEKGDGEVPDETYVGQVLRKYREILHRQRALAAGAGENELDLDEATSEMTVREVLEAAGYDLPSGNLDSLPEPGEAPGGEQGTLGGAQQEATEFQAATEMETDEAPEDEASQAEPLSPEWRELHANIPGASRAQRLPDEMGDEDVGGAAYWAYVNGVRQYGVFVSLTRPAPGVDDVSGLVTEERLYGTPSEYERGDPMVVELHERKPQGLAFTDWRHAHPEAAQQAGDDSQQEADSEAADEQAPPHGGEDEQQQAASEGGDSEDWGATRPEDLLELYDTLADRLGDVEQRVDTVAGDAVLASEVREFADTVETELEELRADLHQVEQAASEAQQEAADAAQNVPEVPRGEGTLGRAQADLGRLVGEDADVNQYSYQQQDGTVTIHLQADLEAEGEGESVPECAECGAPLTDEWQEMNETAKQHGTDPAACPACGGNPLPPVGGETEDSDNE